MPRLSPALNPRFAAARSRVAVLGLVLVAIFLIAACADAEPDTTDADADADGEAGGDIEPQTFQYANPVGEGDSQAFAATVGPWIEQVEEQTDGQITFDVTHGGALLSHPDMMEGVGDGLADFGTAQLSLDPSAFPSWSLSGIHDPDVGTRLSAFEETMATRLMMEEVSSLTEELDATNIQMLFSIVSSPHHLITTFEFDTLDELQGAQIRTYGEFLPRMFEALGTTPVDISPDELFTAMDRGVVDGAFTLPVFFVDAGISEVAEQFTLVGPGTTPPLNAGFHLTVNQDVWEGLDDEVKVVMLEAAREMERQYAEETVPADEAEAVRHMEEEDSLRIHELSEDQLQAWADDFPDLWSEFAEELDADALPGTDLVETYLELTELSSDELEERYNQMWDDLIDQYR